MSQTPRAIAVTDGDLEWTYDDLRRRTEIIAGSLTGHGITRGSVVGMHLPRCADAIATMLGIMASGCVYLPLDPSYPAARLKFMLDRSDAVAVISDGNYQDLCDAHRIVLAPPSRLAAEPGGLTNGSPIFSSEAEPFGMKDPAYILFTSGSTGEPKGVMVTHENITLMNEWSIRILGVTPFDASATTTSLSFDASFHETLLPLSVGGTVHVIPHALALGQLTRQVSFVACTPTVASELLRARLLPSLKVLMVGGEALAPDLAARLLSSGRVGRLLNCYGPTEGTVCATLTEVTDPIPELIPIGRQVPGTDVRILDENGQELPDDEIGEICIFGGQVALGYVNDATGTAERFVVRMEPADKPQRYYRTGDLGYRLNDGVIYFVGRADRQVKINGRRIELEEIDAALRSHSQIFEANTVVQDGDRIVSYVVPTHASIDVDIVDLKRHLSENLPNFLLPAGVVILAEFPKTVNGKLDASALPRWSPGRSVYEPLVTDELTAHVIKIVADVTGFVGQILPSDDFINDLGGTSLGIIRVLVELERYSGRRLRITDALADTSVAGFANLLSQGSISSLADFALHTDGSAPPLFLLHSYLGGMLALKRLAKLLPPERPVYGLQVHCTNEQESDALTVSLLAQDAVGRIRAIQPVGPITMIGHSAGGLIAFEAARGLLEAGDPEPRVLLLDSVVVRNAFDYYWYQLVLSGPSLISERFRLLQMRRRQRRRQRSHQQDIEKNGDLIARNKEYQASTDRLFKYYRAQVYDGNITVMRTRQGRMMALGRQHLGWSSVTKGALKMIDVPGAHHSMLDAQYLNYIAGKITDWLSGKES